MHGGRTAGGGTPACPCALLFATWSAGAVFPHPGASALRPLNVQLLVEPCVDSMGGTVQKLLGTVTAVWSSLALYLSCGSPQLYENSSLCFLSLMNPSVTERGVEQVHLPLVLDLARQTSSYFVEQSSCPSL